MRPIRRHALWPRALRRGPPFERVRGVRLSYTIQQPKYQTPLVCVFQFACSSLVQLSPNYMHIL